MITLTKISKGYEPERIKESVRGLVWEDFRKDNLPFCQGEAIKKVIAECKIPLTGIKKMGLHGSIKGNDGADHGFYGLDVDYKNGNARIYMADSGCDITILATDFTEKEGI